MPIAVRPGLGQPRWLFFLGRRILGRRFLSVGFLVGRLFGQAQRPQARHLLRSLLAHFFFFFQGLLVLLLGCGELFLGPRFY